MFFSLNAKSQNYQEINQIKDSLLNSTTDSLKILNNIRLANAYVNINSDTSGIFLDAAISLSKKLNSNFLNQQIYKVKGLFYLSKSDNDEAIANFIKSDSLAKILKDSNEIIAAYNNIGVAYEHKDDFSKSLKYYLKAIEIAERLNDTLLLSMYYNNIGIIHYKLENYDKALYYYNKSIKYKYLMHDYNGIALLLNNIGIMYFYKDEIDSTLSYFKRSLKMWEKVGNIRQTALVLSNIGELYYEIGLLKSAINYLHEAEQKYTILKSPDDLLSVNNLIGKIYLDAGDYANAEKYLKNALLISDTIGKNNETIDNLFTLSDYYTKVKNYKNALNYYQKASELKDSLYKIESEKAFNELEIKYETEKKNQQIKLLDKKNIIQRQKLEKQKLYFWLFGVGTLLLIIIIILIVKQSRDRKKANELLQLKNAEILQQKEEIMTQKEEITVQRDQASKQRDLILLQKQAINDSIIYAKKIQEALLPQNNIIKTYFKGFFVVYKPKDIVSGDFYWFADKKDKLIIVVSDCTGHGVPGGFMSMLGISFLNEIINDYNIFNPAEILNILRDKVISALKQKSSEIGPKDGMDISVSVIDKKTKVLDWAGANNPLYIIKEEKLKTKENQFINLYNNSKLKIKNSKLLYEIKPDKMPISIYPVMKKFSVKSIQLNKGDKLYMFSDGYADQFGGAKFKKFGKRRFKDLILETSMFDMNTQKSIIETEFDKWKLSNDQIDDVTLLALEI